MLLSAIAPMPKNHPAAITATGIGSASAAIGTPSSIEMMKPKVSGCRGLKRTETRPPPIAPIAPQVETIPQLRAPPRCSLKITGPSTMNAAKQKFEIANPMIGARTHARDVTSRRPSRSSAEEVAAAAARSCAATCRLPRNDALTTKLTASIANT